MSLRGAGGQFRSTNLHDRICYRARHPIKTAREVYELSQTWQEANLLTRIFSPVLGALAALIAGLTVLTVAGAYLLLTALIFALLETRN